MIINEQRLLKTACALRIEATSDFLLEFKELCSHMPVTSGHWSELSELGDMWHFPYRRNVDRENATYGRCFPNRRDAFGETPTSA